MTFSKRLVWTSLSAMLLILSSQLASADDAKDKEKAAQERKEVDAEATRILKDFQGMKGGTEAYNKAAGYAVFKVTKAGLGVSGAGGGEAFPWRFWLPGDPTVSPYKRHPKSHA